MHQAVKDIIDRYNMLPHPEGGYYKETYRCTELIPPHALPNRFAGGRTFSTAIYFLLQRGNFSAFHRIKSDECWHFYAGETLLVYVIDINGELQVTKQHLTTVLHAFCDLVFYENRFYHIITVHKHLPFCTNQPATC